MMGSNVNGDVAAAQGRGQWEGRMKGETEVCARGPIMNEGSLDKLCAAIMAKTEDFKNEVRETSSAEVVVINTAQQDANDAAAPTHANIQGAPCHVAPLSSVSRLF